MAKAKIVTRTINSKIKQQINNNKIKTYVVLHQFVCYFRTRIFEHLRMLPHAPGVQMAGKG